MFDNLLEAIQSLESPKHLLNQKTPFGDRSIFCPGSKYMTVDGLRIPASQASPGFPDARQSNNHGYSLPISFQYSSISHSKLIFHTP